MPMVCILCGPRHAHRKALGGGSKSKLYIMIKLIRTVQVIRDFNSFSDRLDRLCFGAWWTIM